MKGEKFILTDIPLNCGYGRQVLRGIYKYSRPNRPWLFIEIESLEDGSEQIRGSDAAGIISMRNPLEYAKLARRRGQAVVSVGEQVPGSKFPGLLHVGVDPKAIGEMAAEYFTTLGFRNFGAISSDEIGLPMLFHSQCRGDGFAAALRRRKITCDIFDHKKGYFREGEPLPPVSDSERVEHVHRWLMGLPKPLAVFCYEDYAGLCLSELCRRSGLRMPEEVAILGVDDDIYCDMAYLPLSSIAVPAEQVGYEAVRIMDAMLRHKSVSQGPILLPPIGVITRQSTDIMAIEDKWVVDAVSFIRRNAHKGVRVDEVADEVHLPRRTLERRFRNAIGRGLFAEIRRVQIEHVKMMLAQTTETMETLSPQCGFKDVTRMSKAFRKAVGTSPGAYRRQFYGQPDREKQGKC